MSAWVQGPEGIVEIAARPDPGAEGAWVVRVGDREMAVAVRPAPDGSLWITPAGGAPFRAVVSREGRVRWVTVGGHTWRLPEEDPARKAHAHHGNLEAPMPGKVLRVAVREGESVTRGQTLVIVEAMKMEHAVKAPEDGRVAEVRAREGEMVAPGTPLVVLEEVAG